MAIFLPPQESGLGQGIQNITGILSQALQQRMQRGVERQSGSLLQNALSQLGENPSAAQYSGALASALSQGASPSIVDEFAQNLSRFVASERKATFKPESREPLIKVLSKVMSPEEAQQLVDIVPTLSQGGQTQFANFVFDKLARSGYGEVVNEINDILSNPQAYQESQEQQPSQLTPIEERKQQEAVQLKNAELSIAKNFQGIPPKERDKRAAQFYKDNLKDYKALTEQNKVESLSKAAIGKLEEFNNKKGSLPTGIVKAALVNWETGEPRFPSLLKKDAQTFIKIINDFTTRAKDTYGSRVTNFELDRFMKRLPTLANTPAGRREILAYMKSISELNSLYYKTKKEVYSKYGLRNADEQQIEDLVEAKMAEKKESIMEDFADIGNVQKIYEIKQIMPKDMALVKVNGEFKTIKKSQLKKAKEQGIRVYE